MSWSDQQIQKIELQLKAISGWESAHPVALGSWARGELCPKSDLDMLFLGDENKTAQIVREFQEQGLKVRARVPENLHDWTQGVQSKDMIALLIFKAFTPEGQLWAEAEKQKIIRSPKTRRQIFQDVCRERKERNRRFDSINNFLEPNIKQGPGGLRDIDQSLQVLGLIDLKAEVEKNHPAQKALTAAKTFLLKIRHELHLMGFQDQLIGTEQKEIGRRLGFKSHRDFMKEVSKALSRAHFYSDWIFEFLKSSKKHRAQIQALDPRTPKALMSCLRKDSSILMQQLIRAKMDQVHEQPMSDQECGLLLRETILFRTTDELTKAVFQSLWIGKLCPRIKPLVGYVQHDQYHRFAAEAHLLQAVRELKRVWRKPQNLGKLSWICPLLSARDWETLSWVALYHDLAKGQEGQHHADLGEQWVRVDLKGFGVKSEMIDEVAFLVKNHLQLSVAAFRKNPQDPNTWREFFELGFDQKRILMLAVFTVVDIRATNVDAWSDWKSSLLNDCVRSLQSPEKREFYFLTKRLIDDFSVKLGDSLDPILVHYFSKSTIEKDLLLVKSAGGNQTNVRTLRDRKKKTWLRFQRGKDQVGLLSTYVRVLFMSGASIQQAIIQTLPEIGVYDLFQVTSSSSPVQINKRVELGLNSPNSELVPPKVSFRKIEVVSESKDEIVISFQGVDQRGLLWAIASELQSAGISICSARVHTWGRQVEDLIHVKPNASLAAAVLSLNEKWVLTEG